VEATFTFAKVKKKVEGNIYMLGVKRSQDKRKKVTHKKAKLKNTARGTRSGTRTEVSKVSNSQVLKILKEDYKFDILRDPFNPKKYSQTEWKKIKKYLLAPKPVEQKRVMNGLVAMVKNYMDRHKTRFNAPSTIKGKHTDQFGIDSGQLQMSIGANLKKGSKK